MIFVSNYKAYASENKVEILLEKIAQKMVDEKLSFEIDSYFSDLDYDGNREELRYIILGWDHYFIIYDEHKQLLDLIEIEFSKNPCVFELKDITGDNKNELIIAYESQYGTGIFGKSISIFKLKGQKLIKIFKYDTSGYSSFIKGNGTEELKKYMHELLFNEGAIEVYGLIQEYKNEKLVEDTAIKKKYIWNEMKFKFVLAFEKEE